MDEPRKVTRADAFPLAPRPIVEGRADPAAPAPGAARSALAAFLASAVLGSGTFVGLAASTQTRTCGAQRSVTLERRQQREQARAELRAADEAP